MRYAVTVTLNIGLNVPGGEYMDPTDTAKQALEALGEHLSIKRWRARLALAGGTEVGSWYVTDEDTLIVEVQGVGSDLRVHGDVVAGTGEHAIVEAVYNLSERLEQDCIAFRSVRSSVEDEPFRTVEALVGPKAHEWGEFCATAFIPFDGWQE